MLYPQNLPEKLGYQAVIDEIVTLCNSPGGRKQAQKLSVQISHEVVTNWFRQVKELIEARIEGAPSIPPLNEIHHVLPLLKSSGAVLNPEEILEVKDYIAFVAIKNGEHNGIGYVLANFDLKLQQNRPLKELHYKLLEAV